MSNYYFEPCVFYFFNDSTKSKKKFESIHKLTTKNFYIMNELTNIIKIKEYTSYFNVCENSSELNIVELTEEMNNLNLVNNITNDNKLLLKFNIQELILFKNYLKDLTCSKIYILTIINSYKHLLESIQILINNNIIHNHINFDSIFINKYDQPILTNFSFSINISNNDLYQYIKHFIIEYDPTYLEWPIEFHILAYLLTNKLTSLSSHNIHNIIYDVIDNHTILKIFGENIVSSYRTEALNYFQKYINQSYEYILNDILQYSNTWDNYTLSILFLRILIGIHKTININNKFIILFMKLLVSNIHLNPFKRDPISTVTNKFEIILNQIEPKDYQQLFHNLLSTSAG
jgi:hypothetical protein